MPFGSQTDVKTLQNRPATVLRKRSEAPSIEETPSKSHKSKKSRKSIDGEDVKKSKKDKDDIEKSTKKKAKKSKKDQMAFDSMHCY